KAALLSLCKPAGKSQPSVATGRAPHKRVMPNTSLQPTRSGMPCLAAPGRCANRPSAASHVMPPRAAELER
ncbi:hypothetical protein RZS08_25480, partial [Arthrospira platensis SPKY1]|nr:hypothetical protein [Arthrospira platensis SPKY1]